jgi:uridylate kinase
MGMLATVINALALQDALERIGIPARTMTAIQMPQVAEPYPSQGCPASREGRVVILAAGTAGPYFTTDTTAALRAVEIESRRDPQGDQGRRCLHGRPELDPNAVKLERLDYMEVLNRGIEVMDNTASHALHGQQRADCGVQPVDPRQHRAGHPGRGHPAHL